MPDNDRASGRMKGCLRTKPDRRRDHIGGGASGADIVGFVAAALVLADSVRRWRRGRGVPAPARQSRATTSQPASARYSGCGICARRSTFCVEACAITASRKRPIAGRAKQQCARRDIHGRRGAPATAACDRARLPRLARRAWLARTRFGYRPLRPQPERRALCTIAWICLTRPKGQPGWVSRNRIPTQIKSGAFFREFLRQNAPLGIVRSVKPSGSSHSGGLLSFFGTTGPQN